MPGSARSPRGKCPRPTSTTFLPGPEGRVGWSGCGTSLRWWRAGTPVCGRQAQAKRPQAESLPLRPVLDPGGSARLPRIEALATGKSSPLRPEGAPPLATTAQATRPGHEPLRLRHRGWASNWCRASGSTGLTRWWSNPASWERRRSSSCPQPVIATNSRCSWPGRWRSRRATS